MSRLIDEVNAILQERLQSPDHPDAYGAALRERIEAWRLRAMPEEIAEGDRLLDSLHEIKGSNFMGIDAEGRHVYIKPAIIKAPDPIMINPKGEQE